MNIIDYIILAVLAFGLLEGMHKGFLTSFLATCGLVGAWLGAKSLYMRVVDFAMGNESLMALLRQYLEPEKFFESTSQAYMKVSDVVAGGEGMINKAVNSVGNGLGFIADAFKQNVQGQVFGNLSTLVDYLNQTLWTAVFQVLAFVLTFLILYWAANLVVNLLNHVLRFPILRGFDWLLGGLLGLVRGAGITILILSVLPMILTMVVPDMADSLRTGSVLWSFVGQIDLVGIRDWIAGLMLP